ncbi:hypothetical protein [Halostagnicola bangensis]
MEGPVDTTTVVLEFGDGSLLIPVSDAEGNEPGVFLENGVDACSVRLILFDTVLYRVRGAVKSVKEKARSLFR